MAANVETMMYLGETPWHGLGTRIEQAATSAEALRAAEMDWDILKIPVYAGVSDAQKVLVPGYSAIIRDSDGKSLSIMSDDYIPHAPRDAFSFFDDVVGSKMAIYHTAGSLNGGKKIWILAKIPGEIRIPGTDDVTEKYLLLATSFDGTLATIMKMTPVRVVCQNTLTGAIKGSGEFIKIRHRGSLDTRVHEAKRVFGIAMDQYKMFENEAVSFSRTRFSDKNMEDLVIRLFPAADEKEVPTRTKDSRDSVIELFTEGRGQKDYPQIRGTSWAAYNAVTEYVDHFRGTRVSAKSKNDDNSEANNRLNSIWFGAGGNMKAEAFAAIKQIAAMAA